MAMLAYSENSSKVTSPDETFGLHEGVSVGVGVGVRVGVGVGAEQAQVVGS